MKQSKPLIALTIGGLSTLAFAWIPPQSAIAHQSSNCSKAVGSYLLRTVAVSSSVNAPSTVLITLHDDGTFLSSTSERVTQGSWKCLDDQTIRALSLTAIPFQPAANSIVLSRIDYQIKFDPKGKQVNGKIEARSFTASQDPLSSSLPAPVINATFTGRRIAVK